MINIVSFSMKDRFQVIRDYCKGKDVLDVGSTGDLEHHLREKERWIFWHLQDVAKAVVGVDLDKKGVDRVQELGIPNIYYGDAETYKFNKTFDVIVAGEIIEHLDNPGHFLDNMRSQLNQQGALIITTPNTFSINNSLRGLLFAHVPLFHEHVNAYTESLLVELLRRHGFVVDQIYYYTEPPQKTIACTPWQNKLLRALSRLRPHWSESLLVIAKAA